MTPNRWKYLKQLQPAPPRLIHSGGTLDLGRNEAKRQHREGKPRKFWRPLDLLR